jgi:hypothetical protein
MNMAELIPTWPLVTFAERIFFLIMNKQENNELNVMISYVALLVSNGYWKPPRMGAYSAI